MEEGGKGVWWEWRPRRKLCVKESDGRAGVRRGRRWNPLKDAMPFFFSPFHSCWTCVQHHLSLSLSSGRPGALEWMEQRQVFRDIKKGGLTFLTGVRPLLLADDWCLKPGRVFVPGPQRQATSRIETLLLVPSPSCDCDACRW